MKTVIVDYGMGNIQSIIGALHYIGNTDVSVSSDYEVLRKADKLILPGVGSFAKAMTTIQEKKLDQYLKTIVLEDEKPILGICLGMQLMGLSSTEESDTMGLGFVPAEVTKFSSGNVKVPHVGFNQVKVNADLNLYHGISGDPDFYFTHSFRMCSDKYLNQSLCDYGGEFVASYELGHIAGVQFHPELSQYNGLTLLQNFIERL
jgi:imidazole glycerol-phosphate synthase subunit HisH